MLEIGEIWEATLGLVKTRSALGPILSVCEGRVSEVL